MRYETIPYLVLVWLTIIFLVAGSMLPVSAANYTPGVKAGDYVKYSDIGASWQSTASGLQKPQSVTDFQNANFFQIDISSVTGNNVTAKFQAHFRNGTVTLRTFIGNVDLEQVTRCGTSPHLQPSTLQAL